MQSFTYTATVKLVLPAGNYVAFKDEYPGVTDLSVASRQFYDYNECIISCRTFMDDVKTRINEAAPKPIYKVSSEINPIHNNGTATLSKDWSSGEISRLWIFDEGMEKTGAIHAIGQARIFGSDLSERQLAS
jgi:hypothetical protein